MRSVFYTSVLIIWLAFCYTVKPTVSPVGLVNLENYFLKNSVVAATDTNYYFIDNSSTFEEIFGVGKTMDNKIIQPDFNRQWVVAVALKETNAATSLKFEKAEIAGQEMNVYLNISSGQTQSYKIVPLAIATVPRSGNVKSIHFFINGYPGKKMPVN